MQKLNSLIMVAVLMVSVNVIAEDVTPTNSVFVLQSQQQFFNSIKGLCGKAFKGLVTVDNAPSAAFSDKTMIMHVRKCTEQQLQVPFHVGDDSSRTWLITKTGSGLSLKHDHRHQDGHSDKSTMYGGHTLDGGYPQVQSFPADQYSKDLFVELGIPQSMGNTWQMYIYPKQFTYRMIREGREFRVDFDLTKPVKPPSAPWGYSD